MFRLVNDEKNNKTKVDLLVDERSNLTTLHRKTWLEDNRLLMTGILIILELFGYLLLLVSNMIASYSKTPPLKTLGFLNLLGSSLLLVYSMIVERYVVSLMMCFWFILGIELLLLNYS